MPKFIILFAAVLLLVACGEKENHDWCQERTIAEILSLEGATATTAWCATVVGEVVYKSTSRCRLGAYFLQDETGEAFLCDPNTNQGGADYDCHKKIASIKADSTKPVRKKVEVNYYPARELCAGEMLCWCQNGFEVLYVSEP